MVRAHEHNRKKIKVVFGLNDFLVGGVQRQFSEQIKLYDRERFNIELITLFQFPDRMELYDALPRGLSVHKLSFSSFLDMRSWWQLYGLLRRIRPDVVVSSLFFSNTVFRILRIFLGYKSIAREHNTYVDKSRSQQLIDRVLARMSYRIVAVSNSVKRFTSAQERIVPEKFVVIHNGVDVQKIQNELERLPEKNALKRELGFKSEDRIVVNVARLVSQKGQKILLEGFARFRKMFPDYKLAIVGGGDLRAELEELARNLGVSDAVIFFGSRADVWPFYKAADFFVSASYIEGFGIAHAEALACGIPVLSTKTAGPDEMIQEKENGFFIAENAGEAVADGLARMATADLERMGSRAAATVQRYDIRTTVQAYERLIAEAAS